MKLNLWKFLLWALSIVCLATLAQASGMNAKKDFWGEYIGEGTVGFWWAEFPEKTSGFVLYRKLSKKDKWNRIKEFPLECAYSPNRPCLDNIKENQLKHEIYYKLNAIDKNRNIVKEYEELIIPVIKE